MKLSGVLRHTEYYHEDEPGPSGTNAFIWSAGLVITP